MTLQQAVILDVCRTPRAIGKAEKSPYARIHPHMLGAQVLSALFKRNKIDDSKVDDVVWGTSSQRGQQSHDIGRMAWLSAGLNQSASAVTLDRFCGSGLSAINFAAMSLMSNQSELMVAGGSEMMSNYGIHGNDAGGEIDNNNLLLRKKIPQPHQGVCADAIATLEGISRYTLDSIAAQSQARTKAAIDNGYFHKSTVPVLSSSGEILLSKEQLPRPNTNIHALSQLPAYFEKIADTSIDRHGDTYRKQLKKGYPNMDIKHMHHAGNSSGIADGAAAMLLSTARFAQANGIKPRARIVATANAGDCPTLMLNGPVPSTLKVLEKAGLSLSDIDLFEVNEAFAVVPERYVRHLNLDWDKVNVNGGAISQGHPIGATGAILINIALDELERRGQQFALVTMCAAGGMAPSIIIERL